MGNIFIKPKQIKTDESDNINKKNKKDNKNDNFPLKQITVESDGNCNVCKRLNSKGYKIYSIEYNTNSFVCLNCYNSIL